jgi:hypothetical protein
MPLTAAEQRELDVLELRKLNARAAANQPAPAPQQPSVAAPSGMQQFADLRNAPQPNMASAAARAMMPGVSRDASPEMLAIREQAPGMGLDMGMAVGGAVGGQAIGALGGPLGMAAGGFVGGGVGDILGQWRRMYATGDDSLSHQKDFDWGELWASAVASSIPGVGPGGNAAIQMTKQAALGVGGAVAETATRNLVNKGNLGEFKDYGIPSLLAAASGPASILMRDAMPVPFSPIDIVREGQREAFSAVRPYDVKIAPKSIGERGAFTDSSRIPNRMAVLDEENQVGFNRMANKDLTLLDDKGNIVVGRGDSPQRFKPSVNGVPDKEGIMLTVTGDLHNFRQSDAIVSPYKKIQEISTQATKDLRVAEEVLDRSSPFAEAVSRDVNKETLSPLIIKASADIEELKLARNAMKKAYDAVWKDTKGSSELLDIAEKSKAAVDVLEDNIEKAAILIGDPKLLPALRQSRRLIAKSYVYEMATDSTGLINPKKLAALRNAGFMLDGNAEKLANFAEAFRAHGDPLTFLNAASDGANIFTEAAKPRTLTGAAMDVLPNMFRGRSMSDKFQDRLASGNRFMTGPEGPPAAFFRFSMPAVQNVVRGWSPSYEDNFGKPSDQ